MASIFIYPFENAVIASIVPKEEPIKAPIKVTRKMGALLLFVTCSTVLFALELSTSFRRSGAGCCCCWCRMSASKSGI